VVGSNRACAPAALLCFLSLSAIILIPARQGLSQKSCRVSADYLQMWLYGFSEEKCWSVVFRDYLRYGHVHVRTVGFAVSFRSCRAIQGGFLLLAMLCSYLVSDTWPLPSLSRSTGYLGFLLLAMLRSCLVSDTWPLPSFSRSTGHTRSICLSLSARKQGPQASGHSRSKC